MRTTSFTLAEDNLKLFIKACEETAGIEYLGFKNNIVNVEYTDASHLWYLGRIFTNMKILTEL